MKTIRLLSCLTFLATFTSGAEIECEYYIDDWGGTGGSLYTCHATIISLENPTTVTGIRGIHLARKRNANVKGFDIRNHHNLTAIPKGIENFFANLESFMWYNGNVSAIDSSVFKPFPNLKDINLAYNKLITLDGDLFQHTRKLGGIYFFNNLLHYVGHDLLTGLSGLTRAQFRSNPCINAGADTPQAIEQLKIQLPIQCPPLAQEIKIRMKELEEQIRELSSEPGSCH